VTRQFKWIAWNRQKIASHALSVEEVEATFDKVVSDHERKDDSHEMIGLLPSGRPIRVIWRYDTEDDEISDVFGEVLPATIFVITAYGAR